MATSDVGAPRRRRALWVLLPWLVLVVGVATTLSGASLWQSELESDQQGEVDLALDGAERAVVVEMGRYESLLSSVALAFQEGEVGADRFGTVFAPSDLAQYPGILAATWVVPVPEADAPAYAAAQQAMGRDFSIRTDTVVGFTDGSRSAGADLFVVEEAEPPLAADALLGLDVGDSPDLRPTFERVRTEGRPLMTPRLALAPELEFLSPLDAGAFFSIYPVLVGDYERVVAPGDRSASLRGWVAVYVLGQPFLDRALLRTPVRVDVYEDGALLGGTGRTEERAEDVLAADPRTVEVGGRRWTLVPRYVPGIQELSPDGPRRTLLLGLAFSTILSGGLALLGRSRVRALGSAEDALRNLRASEARFRSVVQHASDLILIEGVEGRLAYVSPSSWRLLGWGPDELVEAGVRGLAEDGDGFDQVRAAPGDEARELRLRHRNGSWRSFSVLCSDLREDQGVGGIVYHARDVTDRKAVEARLVHQAAHDPLTGLPNRSFLSATLADSLKGAEEADEIVAVLFVDLDGFKVINDSLGHDAGDALLKSVARRLRRSVRPGDTVTRFGGDEFVLVCRPVSDMADVEELADRVLVALRPPHALSTGDISITASVGIALSDGEADGEALVRNADVAMYRAKERGRNRREVFDEAMRARAVARHHLEHDLRRAIDAGTIDVHYQPIVALDGGRTVAVEALARWPRGHAEVSPAEFIPVAEEMGLIGELGEQVLARALGDLTEWRSSGAAGADLALTVNVSPRQLEDERFPDRVLALLRSSGTEPGALCLEVTEDSYLGADAVEALHRLKRLGLRIALDDFGTGYASLLSLKQLPLDVLKIDRSFVAGLDEDDRFVAAVMSLARAQSLDVVAEGVEVPAQAELLRRLGCQLCQGWLYARPMSSGQLAEHLRAEREPARGR